METRQSSPTVTRRLRRERNQWARSAKAGARKSLGDRNTREENSAHGSGAVCTLYKSGFPQAYCHSTSGRGHLSIRVLDPLYGPLVRVPVLLDPCNCVRLTFAAAAGCLVPSASTLRSPRWRGWYAVTRSSLFRSHAIVIPERGQCHGGNVVRAWV